jgi:hypothetical protein
MVVHTCNSSMFKASLGYTERPLSQQTKKKETENKVKTKYLQIFPDDCTWRSRQTLERQKGVNKGSDTQSSFIIGRETGLGSYLLTPLSSFFFFFWQYGGFKLVSYFLGRYSTTWPLEPLTALFCIIIFFFAVLWLELRTYILSHSNSPFFCDGFFQDRVSWTVCLGWLRTVMLLISASWVARSTSVSHQHPACIGCFWDRVSGTICPGWLWTWIFLISAYWVARITFIFIFLWILSDFFHEC